jgi:hypothetical protein
VAFGKNKNQDKPAPKQDKPAKATTPKDLPTLTPARKPSGQGQGRE